MYDPRLPNDRLLLGMKGTMSEMELSLLRQRSLEALRQKARRGELFFSVAVGYVKVRRDRIAKDPDRRVQEAIALVFRKFAEFQSMRQVHLWLRQEEILLPASVWNDEGRQIVWKLPVYNSVRAILTTRDGKLKGFGVRVLGAVSRRAILTACPPGEYASSSTANIAGSAYGRSSETPIP